MQQDGPYSLDNIEQIQLKPGAKAWKK